MAEGRMIMYSVVSVCVCVCLRVGLTSSCKADISKTNLWIFAKFIADTPYQGSRIRSVRILFFERYVRTLTYAILAYVNKNRIRAWQCLRTIRTVRRQVREQKKVK